jgi:hypothetical protein
METRINDTRQIRNLWEVVDKNSPSPSTYWRKQEKPKKKINEAGCGALKNAKEAAILSLPVITKAGVDMLTGPKGGFIDFSGLGFIIAVGGIVIDTVKAPFFLIGATEEAIRGGILKVASLALEGSPESEQEKRLFESFLTRLRETASLLVSLGLEDKNILNNKLTNGDIEELVVLTLLHTAYASRRYRDGLVLANGNVLDESYCPANGKVLFNKIMNLKNTINEALALAHIHPSLSGTEKQLEESRIVLQWIRLIKEGKIIAVAEKPDATQDQILIVNSIIEKINDLKLHAAIQLSSQPEDKILRVKI